MGQSAPKPHPEPFLEHFSKYITRHHMECALILVDRLLQQFNSMHKNRATGLDGWTVTDMRNMPWLLLQMLAQLLNWIELWGIRPAKLVEGYIPLIPKGEGIEPLQLRPLSVLLVLYGA